MNASALSQILGYSSSARWFAQDRLHDLARRDHGVSKTIHACRKVGADLWGIYLLGERTALTTAVQVLNVPSEEVGDELHRLIWNQDVAPFVLMSMQETVRVCTGFRYAPPGVSDAQRGVLHAALTLGEVGRALDDLRAEQLDEGVPWQRRAADLVGAHRVDARLLQGLQALRESVLGDGLELRTAHALIGRFLYVRHLQDRGLLAALKIDDQILSDGLQRGATVKSLRRLVEAVDERLNGSVFPIAWTGKNAPADRHVCAVASAFLGDDPATGQMHLGFRAYDFSYIPVETLSVVYEQFLTRLDEDHGPSRGKVRAKRREAGVVYTPLPLVNFVLDEMDDARRMTSTTRVLDPACGSGAFLVQCYRRLVSRWRDEHPEETLTGSTLRDLLTKNIYGIDQDEDACRVAEFSLLLALLDHIEKPEQSLARGFKLPSLHGSNIFVEDFFDPMAAWRTGRGDGFDWIVGNPPWVGSGEKGQAHALAWMSQNKHRPVVNRRVAEAFAWEARDHLRTGGRAGLVVEGMTLFSDQDSFRKAFFKSISVESVTNLVNLRRELFDGRAEQPAAVLVYGPDGPLPRSTTCVYSPLLVNQTTTAASSSRRARVWTLCLNQSEVRVIPQAELARGPALTFKLAMWGSPRDERLLQRLRARRDETLGSLKTRGWVARQGVWRRPATAPNAEFVPELVGKSALVRGALDKLQGVFSLPPAAISLPLAVDDSYIDKKKGPYGIAGCRGHHVVARGDLHFAVYRDEFLLVTDRDLGIAVPEQDREFAKMLALYLNSRVVQYFQFMLSPQEGVKTGRTSLSHLRTVPLPFFAISAAEQKAWVDLHDRLAASSQKLWEFAMHPTDGLGAPVSGPAHEHDLLLEELEDRVASALSLRPQDRWLIDDHFDAKRHLVDGLMRAEATGSPDEAALRAYADALRDTVDAFFDPSQNVRHRVTIVRDRNYACAELIRAEGDVTSRVLDAEAEVASALRRVHARVRREHPQWMYFDRNLVVYEAERVCVFKPLQRHAWTRARALADADTVIAEGIAARGSS